MQTLRVDNPVEEKKIFFANLDSIRFIAACMVFLGHSLTELINIITKEGTWERKFLNVFSDGGMGVSIFFVLSGFLITYLLISEYLISSKVDILKFYIRRILRIWPLYFAVIFFSFIVYPLIKDLFNLNDNVLMSNVKYHLTFLSNYDVINILKYHHGKDAMSQNITWSVSIEEQFYFFWPLIFTYVKKRYWLYLIVFCIAFSLWFRIKNFSDDVVLYYHSFSVMLDLAIGGAFAYLMHFNQKARIFFEKVNWGFHLAFFATCFILLFCRDIIFNFKYGDAISRIFISASFALVICAQAMTKQESFLSLKKFRFANKWGLYTYGIYLLHPIAITITDILFRKLNFIDNRVLSLLVSATVSFLLTLVLSKLSYTYLESPFLRLKKKFSIIQTKL